jgi:lysophospholipase L1-like esterase
MQARVLAGLIATAMTATLISGCSSLSSGLNGPPRQRTGSAVTYVSIDEGAPPDFRFAWQQRFYRTALPQWAVAYDLSDNDFMGPGGDDWRSTDTELIHEVTSFRPSVVTVALGLSEVANGVSADTFAAALHRLLTALRDDAVPTVLVANVIPLATSQRAALVHAYNDAIVTLAGAEGDVLVDVYTAFVRAHAAAGVLGGILSARGQQIFAAAFEKAMKHRRDSR